VNPDAGTLEGAIVGVTLLLTIVFLFLARAEWRRRSTQVGG
jgi:hypothetical protein